MPTEMFLCAFVGSEVFKSVCSAPQVSCPMIEVAKNFELNQLYIQLSEHSYRGEIGNVLSTAGLPTVLMNSVFFD